MTQAHIENVKQVVSWQLCIGCGACVYACPADAIRLVDLPNQGLRPTVDSSRCQKCGGCVKVCPGVEVCHQPFNSETIPELREAWGPVLTVWEGYAADPEIRFRGSSGGVVTALSLFCLEKEKASGVLHIGADSETPWQNVPAFSTSRQGLLALSGSRYSPAAPCERLDWIEQAESKCVFIGKPCDVAALRKAQLNNPTLASKVGLAVSLFCAGTPSTQGTKVLMRVLGVELDDVAELRYRGEGWPGRTTVELKGTNSKQRNMSYEKAWGDILCRYGQRRCHLCPDGTGEFADISCGDAWYREPGPSKLGWSLILARTKRGKRILQKAVEDGYVTLSQVEPSVLPQSQKSLLGKRRKLWGRLLGLRMLAMPVPQFAGFSLLPNWHTLPIGEKLKSVLSTLGRATYRKFLNLRELRPKRKRPRNPESQVCKWQTRLQR